MAKQKIVMKVTMTNEKKTRKAFKIAAAVRADCYEARGRLGAMSTRSGEA
ncbi:hypothetical protein HanHA89_Chr11g0411691 [Helianthus annuus]|nr:hypothetical protein HanHA89_Chr11g0411691 [Helianthus annuus]